MSKSSFWSVPWLLYWRHFHSILRSEIWHRWGPSNFFWVSISSGGFILEPQRKVVASGFWATGKTYRAEILKGASFIQLRTYQLESARLVNWLALILNFFRDYFHICSEQSIKKLKMQDIFISCFFITVFIQILRQHY